MFILLIIKLWIESWWTYQQLFDSNRIDSLKGILFTFLHVYTFSIWVPDGKEIEYINMLCYLTYILLSYLSRTLILMYSYFWLCYSLFFDHFYTALFVKNQKIENQIQNRNLIYCYINKITICFGWGLITLFLVFRRGKLINILSIKSHSIKFSHFFSRSYDNPILFLLL